MERDSACFIHDCKKETPRVIFKSHTLVTLCAKSFVAQKQKFVYQYFIPYGDHVKHSVLSPI